VQIACSVPHKYMSPNLYGSYPSGTRLTTCLCVYKGFPDTHIIYSFVNTSGLTQVQYFLYEVSSFSCWFLAWLILRP
jgi:hypothetical protein